MVKPFCSIYKLCVEDDTCVSPTCCGLHSVLHTPFFFSPHQMVAPQGLVGAEAMCEYLLLIAGCSIQGYRGSMLCPVFKFCKK